MDESKEDSPRITLQLGTEMVRALEVYRHKHNLRSRSEAARRLIAAAMERLEGEKGEPE